VHNCEAVWRFYLSDLAFTFVLRSNLLIPITAPHQPLLPTREEQLLAMIATLQQQVNTMLLQQQGSRVEVIRPQVFNGRMEEVSAFINVARIYIRMKITEKAAMT